MLVPRASGQVSLDEGQPGPKEIPRRVDVSVVFVATCSTPEHAMAAGSRIEVTACGAGLWLYLASTATTSRPGKVEASQGGLLGRERPPLVFRHLPADLFELSGLHPVADRHTTFVPSVPAFLLCRVIKVAMIVERSDERLSLLNSGAKPELEGTPHTEHSSINHPRSTNKGRHPWRRPVT